MTSLAKSAAGFLTKEEGTSAVEYAVVLALIIVVCVSVLGGLGVRVSAVCETVCEYAKVRS